MKAKNSFSEEDMGNSAWADVMKNILSMEKPKSKSFLVLSRAVKIDPKEEEDSDEDEKPLLSKLSAQANLKKEWLSRGRCKPNPLEEGERERKLRKIAVAGVVQLFNAVGKHQRSTDSATTRVTSSNKSFKPLDKKSFLGLLLGKEETKNELPQNNCEDEIKEEEATKDESSKENTNNAPKWDVLRNDFMMSTKLKDWDKQLE